MGEVLRGGGSGGHCGWGIGNSGDCPDLVVVAGLEEVDAGCRDAVDEAVFLGDAAGEAAGEGEAEGFGFAWALVGVAEGGFDEVEDAEGGGAVVFDPVAEVGEEFGVEDGVAVRVAGQV